MVADNNGDRHRLILGFIFFVNEIRVTAGMHQNAQFVLAFELVAMKGDVLFSGFRVFRNHHAAADVWGGIQV